MTNDRIGGVYMRNKNIIILTLTIIVTLLFSSCLLQKETADKPKYEPFSYEKADEVALAYLKEKYGEDFVIVDHKYKGDSIAFGLSWQVSEIIKKSQENEINPRKYEVCISKDNTYKILGDTVMISYYEKLYHDFATPIVEKEMENIPFELVVVSVSPNEFYDDYGVVPEAKIPSSFEDENSIFSQDDFFIKIFIPNSYNNYNITEICTNIKKRLTKENYFSGDIVLIENKEFDLLSSASDKYWEYKVNNYYLGRKKYEMR